MDRRIAVVAAALLVSVGIASATPTGLVLTVELVETGEPLATVPVDEGTPVTLAYTHSVERSPVEEVYTVTGTRLDQTRMRFRSYGWGLPAREEVELVDGWFVFDPDRAYDEVVVSTGAIAGHELRVGGTTYDLVGLAEGRSVRLSIERRTLLSGLHAGR